MSREYDRKTILNILEGAFDATSRDSVCCYLVNASAFFMVVTIIDDFKGDFIEAFFEGLSQNNIEDFIESEVKRDDGRLEYSVLFNLVVKDK
jgi:hypothetical protein